MHLQFLIDSHLTKTNDKVISKIYHFFNIFQTSKYNKASHDEF